MDRYAFNVFAPCLILIKYISFSTSAIDSARFARTLRTQMATKRKLSEVGVGERLKSLDGPRINPNWSILINPQKLLKTIKHYHLQGYSFYISLVVQTVFTYYIMAKCIFHYFVTGTNNELAKYYDQTYYFPRLFESHERPDLFYGHTLTIVLYMLSVRCISFFRLLKMSIINAASYEKISITQINYTYLSYIYLPLREWLHLVRDSFRHWVALGDGARLAEHLRFEPKASDASQWHRRGIIYRLNPIDFESCYKSCFPLLYDMDKKTSGKLRNNSCFRHWHVTRPIHRMDFSELGLLAAVYAFILGAMVVGFFVVLFCSLYFELENAVREKYAAQWSFLDTLRFCPEWFEEPRLLIRLADLMILTWIQIPNQFDAVVYFTDILILISRAYKVKKSLDQDRIVCNRYMGDNSLEERAGMLLDARNEHQAWHKESEQLNRRVVERIRMSQVLKAEFRDLKQHHTLYLNTMIFFSGLSIAYSISLIILSTSFSTFVAISINAIIELGPLTACVITSAVLNSIFKGINRNFNLLVINERRYLTPQTVKYLMIECETFQLAQERSIQIAGTFSITPESLGPLIAYISTCILFLTNKFKSN